MLGKYITVFVLGVFVAYITLDFFKGFHNSDNDPLTTENMTKRRKAIREVLYAYRIGDITFHRDKYLQHGAYAVINLIDIVKPQRSREEYIKLCKYAQLNIHHIIDSDICIRDTNNKIIFYYTHNGIIKEFK